MLITSLGVLLCRTTVGASIDSFIVSGGNHVHFQIGDFHEESNFDKSDNEYASKNLRRVVLPDGVTSIGKAAFRECNKLWQINFPDSIETIEERAFQGCNIKSLVLPANLKTIGESAFRRCTGLKKMVFPDGIESIGDRAFRGCSGLKEVKIPGSVKKIPLEAFAECDDLEGVVLEDKACELECCFSRA